MRREKHVCGRGGRELQGQEESTGVDRSVLGTGGRAGPGVRTCRLQSGNYI